jgi:hypothetical protein
MWWRRKNQTVTTSHSFSFITELLFKKDVTKASATSLEIRARLRRRASHLCFSSEPDMSKVKFGILKKIADP